MITTKTKKKIFLTSPNVDLSSRVLDKRTISVVNKISSLQSNKTYDILTVEIACLIDQRVLLEEKVTDVKVFVSNVSLEELKARRSLIQEAKSKRSDKRQGALSLFDRKKSKKISRKETEEDKLERHIEEQEADSIVNEREVRTNIINVVYDIDNLNQNSMIEKFKNLKFLTKLNVNQILGSAVIKNIQGITQTDDELFGRRNVFEVRRTTTPKFRKLNKRLKSISTDSLPVIDDGFELPSVLNFRKNYFYEIKMGRDPLIFFSQKDPEMTLEDRLRGSKKNQKAKETNLRRQFKKIANDKINATPNEELGFRIIKKKVSNRNRICKTTFEMSRAKIRSLSQRPGGFNLIFFAFDEHGRRIDSFEQKINASSLFQTEKNPTIDFNLNCVRTARGNIITRINNQELQDTYFNFHQKSFAKSQNYMNAIFEDSDEKIFIKSKNSLKLTDGKEQNLKSPLFSKSKTIFQRINPYFEGEEIANTNAASVASTTSDEQQLSCTVIATQEPEAKITNVFVSNLSEDVFAVLPVKRIAKGTRGTDFAPLKNLVDGRFVDIKKSFVRDENFSDTGEASFAFTDEDVENGVIYEYAAILYNRSGFSHLSGNRFLEKRDDREGLVRAEVRKEETDRTIFDEGSNQIKRRVRFDVTLNREEDDVDKIINSIFGDNRSLFNDDLSSIKDASNLIYGVRVHKIDTLTGEYSFVGSFRGYKQKDTTSTASSDIPKIYKASFSDYSPAFSTQIYKFDPYIIPPSQVLDKVYKTLELAVKSKSKSRSTLNKMLVSKQKILNKDIISSVGTKFAGVQGRKGAISSIESLLEKNKNDLFLEGVTGDIVYERLPPVSIQTLDKKIDVRNASVSLIKTLDRDERNKNYIPKKVAKIKFDVGSSDSLIDFYVIVKQFNKDPNIVIEGAMHSKDITSRNQKQETGYSYLSEVKTSVGLIRYYLFGIAKNGTVVGPQSLGALMLEGE